MTYEQFTVLAESNLVAAAIGFVAATIAAGATLLWQAHRERHTELRRLSGLLISIRDELQFYADKIRDPLIEQLEEITEQTGEFSETGKLSLMVPSYSFDPTYLKDARRSLSDFDVDSQTLTTVVGCIFELCHLADRVAHLRSEIAQAISDIHNDRFGIFRNFLVADLTRVAKGTNGLAKSTLAVFQRGIPKIETAIVATQAELEKEEYWPGLG